MDALWLFYQDTYQQVFLHSDRKITIGSELEHTLTISKFPASHDPFQIEYVDGVYHLIQDSMRGIIIELDEAYTITAGDLEITIFVSQSPTYSSSYYIGHKEEVNFSIDTENSDLQKDPFLVGENGSFIIYKTNDTWELETKNNVFIYKNGHRIVGKTKISVGDILFWPLMTITFTEIDVIQVESNRNIDSKLIETKLPQSEMQKKYPIYRRTPRMLHELPEDKVQLSFPSQETEDNRRSLWLIILPPLMMIIVMAIVAIVIPRGIYIIISAVMFTTTIITSTVQYFREKGNRKRSEERRKRVYTLYLENKREELQKLSDRQKEVLNFRFPPFERMKYLTEQISDRIWERTPESSDFLQFRLGVGTVPASYNISVNASDMSNREMDELLEDSQKLERTYQEIKNLPITANLAEGAIGLIGKEAIYKNELHQLIGQLAFYHSYHDVRFVFIFNEDEYNDWEWLKWLPHFELPQTFAKAFIYNESTRDQLLSSIYEVLRERDLEEDKENLRFSPHFVFFITNQQLISEHVILEYLEREHQHLGISVVFAAEAKESFSDNIHTLIRYIDDYQGDILIKQKKAVRIPFELDQHHQEKNENYARMLLTLDHQVGMTNSIPSSVSFLEMLDVKEVDDLAIGNNWLTHESAKSLAVPIGLKGKSDLVYLNLHEKAHGPHGLLAGTTGSGKSEFLQSYILSLAVHFHPHEVAFLLIDYKGGGMAQPFKNIHHLLGTITNIEGSKNFSARALASIKSELKRRQRLFDKYEVNHINDYTKLYKQRKTDDPLPHLFLISDEFAELKSEEPEFIKELVSAARIGRSLGVHLILATQKPGGVIDEQIWSNARFRVALKVQNNEDSREILKNGDAAAITVTGRGYLQVGNNEVYELFQSAWSGASYQKESSFDEEEVAIVTDLGLIPLSEVAAENNQTKDAVSEMEIIVDKIEKVQSEMQLRKLSSPWLPPLSDRMYQNDFVEEEENTISFSVIDEPEKQSQTVYSYKVLEDGNVGIFGSSGYGKTQTVITLLSGLANRFEPEAIHFYLLDFGNGGLLPLKQLPHTADYFLIDQERKIDKFLSFIRKELSDRKELFQFEEVSSIKMYNKIAGKALPLIFVAIDNFDVVKEEMFELETQINQLARDGQSLGVYMIITATRVNAVRQSIMNNLKMKVVHYLMDHAEASGIIGRTPFAPEAIPGRAIIKTDEAYFSQVLLPTNGVDDFEQLDELKENVKQLIETYKDASKPEPIPMLPLTLTLDSFDDYIKDTETTGLLPVGLDEEHVKPLYVDLNKMMHCLVLGQAQMGKSNVLKVLIRQAIKHVDHPIAVFDSIDRGLSGLMGEEAVQFVSKNEQILSWLDKTEEILYQRVEEYQLDIEHGGAPSTYTPILFVIDGYARFVQTVEKGIQDRLLKFMKDYGHLGFNLIVSGSNNELSKGYDPLILEIKQIRQAIVLMKKSEQTLFNLPFDRKEPDLEVGFGYYVENAKEKKIKVPHMVTEAKVEA
ncbi:type VII secretion protein EssC [Aquibacillus rhizosphaerae]|uniref:Type VII secretion protein EssC n=1 Tax=Aquibacillus rhizosphaerae TaxID=3051431 RepID=A0ABT7L7G7_9BACI|nr:type VII secretion protein EssC [Aquibacillus sp. LR5S19]MDL4840550.1 type VII secretion protein EssC [Aquibacillus sp. LR5S19]